MKNSINVRRAERRNARHSRQIWSGARGVAYSVILAAEVAHAQAELEPSVVYTTCRP
jgi:hypothetical protein